MLLYFPQSVTNIASTNLSYSVKSTELMTTLPPTNNLFAAVDMGSNSFKLTIVRFDPSSCRFFTVHRIKKTVLLGLDDTSISNPSTQLSISTLHKFQNQLRSRNVPPSRTRIVATSAVRESSNSDDFVHKINEALDSSNRVEILSGTEEARLTYLGVLQFFPLFDARVLSIDIGGGSTEFTVGFQGNVLFAKSLKLGHVTLTTQEFSDVTKMREHVQEVIRDSGLIDVIKGFGLDAVVGSSGTIRAIGEAVCSGYTTGGDDLLELDKLLEKDWKFNREDLRCFVKKLCEEAEMGLEGKKRWEAFFNTRARFILAGTILLDEICNALGIREIEVAGYALGEGVVAEMLGRVYEGVDLNVSTQWRSVVRLASRFHNKKRMKVAGGCAGIARDIFKGLMKMNAVGDSEHQSDGALMSLNDKDLEYLEAASLLHNIGLYTKQTDYQMQSYRVVKSGNQLHGYTAEEIELIGLLVKHHREKLPDRVALDKSNTEGADQTFRMLCSILRLSVAVQKCLPKKSRVLDLKCSPDSFKLVLSEGKKKRLFSPKEKDAAMLEKEFENFKMVFKKTFSVVNA